MTSSKDKNALKQLRQERKAVVEKARLAIKEQNKMIKAVKTAIQTEAKTVPQIAAAIGRPADQVLLFIATLRKYGEVLEIAKDGDYYTYRLADPA